MPTTVQVVRAAPIGPNVVQVKRVGSSVQVIRPAAPAPKVLVKNVGQPGPPGPAGPAGAPGAVQKVSGVAPDGSGNVDLSATYAAIGNVVNSVDGAKGAVNLSTKYVPQAPGFVADGKTYNAAAFAAIPANSGVQQLPKGVLMCNSPLYLSQRSVIWQGQGSNPGTAPAQLGTVIRFNATTLMTGGNTATVAANGTTWTFTVPATHGLSAGNIIRTSGFTNPAFNVRALQIASVTPTTLVVNNTTVPAASDSGKVNPYLIVLGAVDSFTAEAMLRNLMIDCRSIPGACGAYTNSVQDMGGFERLTVLNHNGGGWGVTIDGSQVLGLGSKPQPLNYVANNIRVIRTTTDTDPNSGGYDEYGGNVANGCGNYIGAAGGQTACKAAIKINKANGLRFKVHGETCQDAVLIGDEAGCNGLTVLSYSSAADVTNAIRIANPADGSQNAQIRAGSGQCYTGVNILKDDPNGVTIPSTQAVFLGDYQTDVHGNVVRHSLQTLQQSPPSVTVQANAGTGATASVSGDDLGLTVTITTGTSPSAGGQASVSFCVPKSTSGRPRGIRVTPQNTGAANARLFAPVGNIANATFLLNAGSAPPASTACTVFCEPIY